MRNKQKHKRWCYKRAEALIGRHVGVEGGRRLGNNFSTTAVYLYLKPKTVWTDWRCRWASVSITARKWCQHLRRRSRSWCQCGIMFSILMPGLLLLLVCVKRLSGLAGSWSRTEKSGRHMIRFELPRGSACRNIRRFPTHSSHPQQECVRVGRGTTLPSRKRSCSFRMKWIYGEVGLASCTAVVTQPATSYPQLSTHNYPLTTSHLQPASRWNLQKLSRNVSWNRFDAGHAQIWPGCILHPQPQ